MITLENVAVKKWYGHFQVLTDCSTEVKKGEVGGSLRATGFRKIH